MKGLKLMHALRRIATLVAFLAFGLAGTLTAHQHALADGYVVGHVYVDDNPANLPNTIAAYNRHADGSLSPVNGSPFAAGGTGAAVPSAGAIQLSSDGRYLLAVDAGSNQVSVLRIGGDGSLHPVWGSPFSSGGVTPVSIAVHGPIVVVANDGNSAGGANYTGFFLLPGGYLLRLPGAVYPLPAPTTVGQVLFSPDGRHLIGTRVNSSLIDSFTVSFVNLFHPAAGSPFTTPNYYGQFGSKFRPTNPDQLYVSNAHDGAGKPAIPGTVSAFTVAGNGALSPIGASPYSAGQNAPCWVEISHDGRHLYSVNTASNSVSSFAIIGDGSLTLLGFTPLRGNLANLGALDAGIDPADHFLYVVERGANAVAGLQVNPDGTLTELASSPTSLPAGSAAFGIVVN